MKVKLDIYVFPLYYLNWIFFFAITELGKASFSAVGGELNGSK